MSRRVAVICVVTLALAASARAQNGSSGTSTGQSSTTTQPPSSSMAEATRPGNANAPAVAKEFVEWGAGPRASQFLVLGAKALALLRGSLAAETADVREVAASVLQHRVIVNYRATGAGKKSQHIVAELLKTVQEKSY